jgi:flagellar hook-length control protein FliK
MSALTLMSVIAPSIPGVPQGSSGEAATGFQDLLTALSAEAGAGRSARAGVSEPSTEEDATGLQGLLTVPADGTGAGRGNRAGVSEPSTGEDATGLQGLLAVPADGTGAGRGTRADAAEAPTPGEEKAGTEAETPTLTGFLVAPTPAPVPVAPPAVEETATAAGTSLTADAGAERTMDATPAPAAPAVAAGDPDVPATTTPVLVEKGRTAKTNEPQVLPFVADVRPLRGPPTEVRPSPPTLTRAAPVTGAVEATAPAAAATSVPAPVPAAEGTAAAAPAPALVQAQLPPPALTSAAPLRPLAERTSRPSEAAPAGDGDGQRLTDASRPAAAVAPTSAAAPARNADLPVRPVDFAAIGAREGAGAEGEDVPAEALPAGEAATVQTQAPAAARESVVSQLSRATVEATAQIAAQILRRLEGRSTRFEMALTPDELGRVDVKLDIDSEGRLNARLAFDNPAAATDLRGRADELRRQLEDAGFHLAADAFEFADRDSGSSAFDRGQDTRNGSSRAFAAASRLNAEIDVAQPPRWMALSLSPSGVDMKV